MRKLIDELSATQWSRFLVLRVFFFGLLSFDLITITFKHAARYGVDGFNVSHLGVFDALVPIPVPGLVAVLMLCCAVFAALGAFGVGNVWALRACATLYGGIYLSSQLDSYQHHYMNALLLGLLACLPRRFWDIGSVKTSLSSPLILLIYWQIAFLYFWTAIAKIDSTWLSGVTMMSLSQQPELTSTLSAIAQNLYGVDTPAPLALDAIYVTLSHLIIVGEAFVALCFIVPRLRIFGLCLGPFFHVSVEFLGLDIELFSIYMIGLNLVLLSPNGLWLKLDHFVITRLSVASRGLSGIGRRIGSHTITTNALLSNGLILLISVALYYSTPEFSYLKTLVIGFVVMLLLGRLILTPTRRPSLVQTILGLGVTCGVFFGFTHSDALYDYHRMMGGDLSRRLPLPTDDRRAIALDAAIETYQRANSARPDRPARRLKTAKLLRQAARQKEADEMVREGMRIHKERIQKLQRQVSLNLEDLYELVDAQVGFAELLVYAEAHGLVDPSENAAQLLVLNEDSTRRLSQAHRLEFRNANQAVSGYLATLSGNTQYQAHNQTIALELSVPVELRQDCAEQLRERAAHRLTWHAYRLGGRKTIDASNVRLRMSPSAECSGTATLSIRTYLRARASNKAHRRLQRKRTRVFGSNQ